MFLEKKKKILLSLLLEHDKLSDRTKLGIKCFTRWFWLHKVKNMVQIGENACYQYFLLFPPYFQKPLFFRSLTLSQTTNFRLFQTERFCI